MARFSTGYLRKAVGYGPGERPGRMPAASRAKSQTPSCGVTAGNESHNYTTVGEAETFGRFLLSKYRVVNIWDGGRLVKRLHA